MCYSKLSYSLLLNFPSHGIFKKRCKITVLFSNEQLFTRLFALLHYNCGTKVGEYRVYYTTKRLCQNFHFDTAPLFFYFSELCFFIERVPSLCFKGYLITIASDYIATQRGCSRMPDNLYAGYGTYGIMHGEWYGK